MSSSEVGRCNTAAAADTDDDNDADDDDDLGSWPRHIYLLRTNRSSHINAHVHSNGYVIFGHDDDNTNDAALDDDSADTDADAAAAADAADADDADDD